MRPITTKMRTTLGNDSDEEKVQSMRRPWKSAVWLAPPSPPKLKWIRNRINAKIPSRRKLGLVAIEQQIRKDGMHRTSTQGGASQAVNLTQTSLELFVHKRLHPSAMMSLQKPNKTLRKPDWPPQHEAICAGGYTLSLSWLFKRSHFLTIWDQMGRAPTT